MAAPVITTHQIYQARPGIVFKQYVGNAAIAQHPDLKPGDVLVDIESKTVSYIGEDNVHLPWTGVTTAKETRHPTIQPHYILVPLQRRFSWLSHTGGVSALVSPGNRFQSRRPCRAICRTDQTGYRRQCICW